MHEELQLALMELISPERLAVLLDAHRVLTDLGLTDVDDELQQILGLQDGISDTDLFLSRIDACLILAMGGVLRQYGVTVSDVTPMPIMTALLQTLGSIEHYILPSQLRDLTYAEETYEEILCELVPLLSDGNREEVFEYLVEVRESTILRIRQVAEDNQVRETPPQPNDPRRHDRIAKLNRLARQTEQRHPKVVLTLAKSGIHYGHALEQLLEVAAEQLDNAPTDAVAPELLGLILYSDHPLDNPRHDIKDVIETFTDDYREQVRLEDLAMDYYIAL